MSEREGPRGGGLPANPPRIPGLPSNATFYELAEFKGLNVKAPRTSIDAQEMAWCHNLVPLHPYYLHSIPDNGPAFFSPTGTTGSTGSTGPPAPPICGTVITQTTAWNPAAKNPNVVLSNSNFTANLPFPLNGAVLGTVGKTTGKWYFVVRVDATIGSTGFGVGVGNSSASLARKPGNQVGDTNSIGAYAGNIYTNGLPAGVSPAFGLYVIIAVDLNNSLFWVGTTSDPCVPAQVWNQLNSTNNWTPSNGAGGVPMPAVNNGTPVFPMFGGETNIAGNDTGTLVTNVYFSQAALNGYSLWDGI